MTKQLKKQNVQSVIKYCYRRSLIILETAIWGQESNIGKILHQIRWVREGERVAEVGSLSSKAKMAMKFFVKRVFTIFATNASVLRTIANLQIQLRMICNIYHVIVHFLPKKHCF